MSYSNPKFPELEPHFSQLPMRPVRPARRGWRMMAGVIAAGLVIAVLVMSKNSETATTELLPPPVTVNTPAPAPGPAETTGSAPRNQ